MSFFLPLPLAGVLPVVGFWAGFSAAGFLAGFSAIVNHLLLLLTVDVGSLLCAQIPHTMISQIDSKHIGGKYGLTMRQKYDPFFASPYSLWHPAQ